MSKRTTFTTISPLPADISRQAVIDFLHNHEGMIDLNPLVIERHPLPAPPPHCPEEERECVWWSLRDKISYLPGVKSDLSYTAAFQDMHDGIRTHCYAPMSTHIVERWSLGGTLPGEPKQPVELGLGAPSQGLYIREDVEVRCNFLMAGFVKKTILKAHGVLCENLVARARESMKSSTAAAVATNAPLSSPSSTTFHGGYSASSGGSSSSTYEPHRSSYFGGASEASTLQSRRYSPPAQHQQNQNNSTGVQSLHDHQGAAGSEDALAPGSTYTGQDNNQTYTGQGWQAQQKQQKPYVHDPHNPYTQSQAPQILPLSELGNTTAAGHGERLSGGHGHNQGIPIAELSGSETHIAELQ